MILKFQRKYDSLGEKKLEKNIGKFKGKNYTEGLLRSKVIKAELF